MSIKKKENSNVTNNWNGNKSSVKFKSQDNNGNSDNKWGSRKHDTIKNKSKQCKILSSNMLKDGNF